VEIEKTVSKKGKTLLRKKAYTYIQIGKTERYSEIAKQKNR